MKNVNNFLFIIIASLLLQSCIANKPATKKKLSTSASTSSTTPTTPTFASDESLYWFTSTKISGTVTLNKNSESIIYLRGSSIHNFLLSTDSSNNLPYYQSSKAFCIIGNYGTIANGYKQLRVRAVPIFISNYATKTIERLFRVDVPSSSENNATCGSLTVDEIAATDATFSISGVCPNCLSTSLATSLTLKLFQRNLKVLTEPMVQIPTSKLSLAPVAIKVDLQSNSESESSICTNSSCESKGFDCCIQGQCVKDASQKSSAKDDMTAYNQAMSEYAVNPLSFLNWPNIFNICTNISHNLPAPPTDPNAPTPQSAAEKRVAAYLDDYKCIEQVQNSNGALASLCKPSGAISNYNDIKKKLAISCGCPASYDADTMAIKCPNWGVRPLYKSSVESIANIIDFYCYAPVPEDPLGPITNLNVLVSSRSAPHRFYANTTGDSYDSLTGVPSSVVQEGTDFYYLDDINKSSPINGSYNVNSILGRMNVALSHTQPAKMVAIELGKTYILSSTSGYFTPCSTCAKDSWFQNFTAHPPTTRGVGLRASGFTTSRDTYSANTTFGNYEDTHFGRACYLPVTMIPLSHKKDINLITQRKNRLATQSAFYINGYQKDWFGFNKGALIGSFDGVFWFAVGSGRRITATSTKLYLAINASFLDLADRTDTVVNIIPDISGNAAADYDYDPSLTINDSRQNTAGSCQQYHQCSTDADCVTQLGWEYSCADVSQNKSRWPLFDTNGKELVGQEKVGTIFEILSATTTIGGGPKRCVYRGAGAPCIRDFTTLDGKSSQKNLTCAPNFYCAELSTSRFNDELVRSPNEFDNIFFGMDTNVLGRPLKYVTATKILTSEIIGNIRNNGASDALGLSTSEVNDMGICRPGKSLSANSAIAHSTPDSAKRTDYINQIASCDSTATNSNRTISCPAFGDDLDYLPYNSVTPYHGDVKILQNSCGGEAKHTTTLVSAFKNIEGGSLAFLNNITTPIFAADACLRRAGSVCHTDLDCGPNKMHEDIAGSMALSYFGGTEAEQNYWKESLVCGQGAALPTLGSVLYSTYKLSENRCCREIGKDFTMFTSGPNTLIPENGMSNVSLDTKKFTAIDPKASNRYSRYTISPTALADPTRTPSISANTTPLANQWKVINETGSLTCCGGGWIRKFADGTHDWKIKNRLSIEPSNFSCLNFRSPLASSSFDSFGDSSLDMVVRSTYQREYEYFCKSPGENGCMQILFKELSGFTLQPPSIYNPSDTTNLPADEDLNTYPAYTTASPYDGVDLNGDNLVAYSPSPPSGHTRLDTMPIGDNDAIASGQYISRMNSDVPYQPFPYVFKPIPLDSYQGNNSFMISKDFDYGLHIYLPAYIPYFSGKTPGAMDPCNTLVPTVPIGVTDATAVPCLPTVKSIYVKYKFEDGHVEVVNITNLKADNNTKCEAVYTSNLSQPVKMIERVVPDQESWCVSASTETQNRPVLSVKAYTGAGRDWVYASVIIDFVPIELYRPSPTVTTSPGNAYYYLTKLGKLELLGIPQITYEPLYCNSNKDNLVPGIFNSSIQTRSQFALNSFDVTYHNNKNYDDEGVPSPDDLDGNPSRRGTFQDKLAHGAVFSAKDFACCTPLGKTTTSAAKCCSSTASTTNGVMTCKLPAGTDLNVYFNKFVSSEGVGDNQPSGGLIISSDDEKEIDFNQYTGEPKMRTSTYLKLEELGRAYCLNGIVGNGGSFGRFPPEPYTGYIHPQHRPEIVFPVSILDSIMDVVGQDSPDVGQQAFQNGYRWDHHYYCK